MSADERTLGERVEEMLDELDTFSLINVRISDCQQARSAALLREQQAEIERLTKERDFAQANSQLVRGANEDLIDANTRLTDERDSLRRDLEAARVDAERLDWIEQGASRLHDRSGTTVWYVEIDPVGATFRAAIDLARARGEGPE